MNRHRMRFIGRAREPPVHGEGAASDAHASMRSIRCDECPPSTVIGVVEAMKGPLLPAGSFGLAGVPECRRSPEPPGPRDSSRPKNPPLSPRVPSRTICRGNPAARASGWPLRDGALLLRAETDVYPGPGVWSRGNGPSSCAGQGAGVGSGQGVPTAGPAAVTPPQPARPPGGDRRRATSASASATVDAASRSIASYEAPDETHRAVDAVHRLIASSEWRGFGASAKHRLSA
jgi:hypothetical protein